MLLSVNRSGQSQNLPQPFQPLLFCRGPGPIVEQRFQVAGCVHLADGVAQAAVRVQELDVRLGLLVVNVEIVVEALKHTKLRERPWRA